MYFDLINVLEFSGISAFDGFICFGDEWCLVLFLDANLSVIVVLASKQDMLVWLNFQVVAASKRMNLFFETFCVFNNSCSFITDTNNINTLI